MRTMTFLLGAGMAGNDSRGKDRIVNLGAVQCRLGLIICTPAIQHTPAIREAPTRRASGLPFGAHPAHTAPLVAVLATWETVLDGRVSALRTATEQPRGCAVSSARPRTLRSDLMCSTSGSAASNALRRRTRNCNGRDHVVGRRAVEPPATAMLAAPSTSQSTEHCRIPSQAPE